MGIYVFNRPILRQMLDNSLADFGKHVIPSAIQNLRAARLSFRLLGRHRNHSAFFEANLDVTNELPRFNFFDMEAPIFSHPRFLPDRKSTAPD